MKELRVAMLGFGGIAKSHKRAYEQFETEGTPIRLVAVCDIDPEQFTKVEQINLGAARPYRMDGIAQYTDLDKMLAEQSFDMVDICLPTYLHKEYTLRMLAAGKHVMCEKPMSLCEADCREMLEAAKKAGKLLMIGMCLRFEPQYLFLKDIIDSGRFGALRYLNLSRLSPLPKWSFENWFQKTEKSGGCALDLHIHDVDMVRFLLGDPRAVSAVAQDDVTRWQYISSRFFYDQFCVEAVGSWMEAPGCRFAAGYRACFEKATVILEKNVITVYPVDGDPYNPEIGKENRMAEEIRLLARCINEGVEVNTVNTPESAAATVALVKKLCESADLGGKILEL